MEYFSYKRGCDVTRIKAFKRKAGSGYRQMALGYLLFKTVIPLRV